MDNAFFEHFKPYVPNPNTRLGKAYLCAVKDCDGVLLATEANFLRDNPTSWLRAISLYAANLDFLIRQSKSRLKLMAPASGEVQSKEYLDWLKEHRKWSIVQEHRLNKIRARRAELVMELGYQNIKEVLVTGDFVDVLSDILAAVKQENWIEIQRLAEYWITKVTGLDATEPEEPEEFDATAALLKFLRGGERS